MTAPKSILSLALAVMIFSVATHGALDAQTVAADVRNFRAVDVSSDTLTVSVEYMFRGELPPGGVMLVATPEEAGGVFDPRTVRVDERPVRPGIFTSTLTITKREGARDFTSVAVRVCLSTSDRALVCRDFPHVKQWTAAVQSPTSPVPAPPTRPSTPPAPLPSPAPVPETCSIEGTVTGHLEGTSSPDHPGGVSSRFRLRHIAAAPAHGRPVRVGLSGRRFTFRGLRAGVVYRVFPSGFSSTPRHVMVTCRTHQTHVVSFRLLGPIGEG
jgi:hypothetical protein